jgi:multimeric flavodoxin WrbA
MSVQVLGVSGSPVPNSNTDRAVQAVLEATGLPGEFIKLSRLRIEPCRACLGCVGNNQCVIKDDACRVADKFRWAKAVVVGGYTPYGSLDSRTKAFMERMFCLRHRIALNRGKFGAAVITSAMDCERGDLPPAGITAARQITCWMQEEGITNVGTLLLPGNAPCVRCGWGDNCKMSTIRAIAGPRATVESVGLNQFEESPSLLASARELGLKLRRAILSTDSRPPRSTSGTGVLRAAFV